MLAAGVCMPSDGGAVTAFGLAACVCAELDREE